MKTAAIDDKPSQAGIDALALFGYRTEMPKHEFLENDAFLTAELLALAVESAGIGVWRVNPQTREVELTAVLKEMLGLPADRSVDYASFLSLLHPDDLQRTRDALAAALASADGHCDIGFRVVTPANGVRRLTARGRAYFDGDGEARRARLFIGTMRDVTEAEAAEATLTAALEQQKMLLHEVNHRVKNSLQLVSSLLRLQARRIPEKAARQQLEDATTRISTIAHIHQRLYRDEDISRINFGALLSELCADLQGSAAHCSLDVRAPDFPVKTDRAIPLALVVNELVSNAFKYAYPSARGRVSVGVELSDSAIAISVQDHGVGLPQGFTAKSDGNFGMLLIGSLLTQLSGKLVIRETEGGGATFIVTTPID